MIYKVIVSCVGEEPRFPKKPKLIRCSMSALVDEPSIDEAIVAGVNYVQSKAPMDARWHSFEFTQCSPVSLPILVKSI